MAQDRTDTVFENKFYDTKFYFDWNSGSQSKSKYGNVWPGLIFTETEAGLHSRLDPYIRGDVEDDTDDEESNSDFDFNDLQDGKRETYLNTFQCSYNKNKKPVTLIKVNAPNLYKDDYDQLCSVIQLSDAVIAGSVNADYSNIKTSDNVPQKLLIELKKDSEFANSFIYYNGKPVYGMTPDGIIANGDNSPRIKNIKYDGTKDQESVYAEISGVKYWLYTADDNTRLYNIAMWGDNFYLYIFTGESGGNTKIGPVVYRERNKRCYLVKQNWNDVVALETNIPEVEMLNVYEQNDKGITKVEYWQSYRSTRKVWVEARNLIKPHKKKKPKDAKTAREEAIKNENEVWRTPTEYYTQQHTDTNNIRKGNTGYVRSKVTKVDEDQKKTVPIWWWSNTFKNWCTFKKVRKHTLVLYVWNGRDGWDSMNDIIKALPQNDIVIDKYFYDLRYFSRGHSAFSIIPYDSMQYEYKQIRLTGDTKFSHYDSETFQTIKIAKAHVDNKGTQRYPTTAGIPPISRVPSGELICYYYLKIPGMSKQNEVIWDENVDFVNSVCQAYFESGDDKTIKDDWKVFDKINDDSEEVASDIFSIDESSLVDAEEINTTKENKNVVLLSLTVPRQYPEGKNITPDSYVERWEF